MPHPLPRQSRLPASSKHPETNESHLIRRRSYRQPLAGYYCKILLTANRLLLTAASSLADTILRVVRAVAHLLRSACESRRACRMSSSVSACYPRSPAEAAALPKQGLPRHCKADLLIWERRLLQPQDAHPFRNIVATRHAHWLPAFPLCHTLHAGGSVQTLFIARCVVWPWSSS
jgi:hypothetical protein